MNELNLFYSVWVGGIEANDFYLSKNKALDLYEWYIENGYTDVCIEALPVLSN